ncbi:MAG TPA: Lsr2 family protein [Frankiaceae bacterium]|jgi:hypothetical protein|nr:Lsr2 family protein [Frankiaceae bacterium]
MVERRTVELVDDLDGGRADETVRFAIDSREYEIDLSGQNARKLREAVHPYVAAARQTGTRRPHAALPGTVDAGAGSDDSQQIRDWARARGLEVSSRGRIPAYLRQAYERR